MSLLKEVFTVKVLIIGIVLGIFGAVGVFIFLNNVGNDVNKEQVDYTSSVELTDVFCAPGIDRYTDLEYANEVCGE